MFANTVNFYTNGQSQRKCYLSKTELVRTSAKNMLGRYAWIKAGFVMKSKFVTYTSKLLLKIIPTAPHFIGVKDDGSFRDISISSKSPAIANYPKTPNNVITENNRFMVSNDMTMYTCTPG